MSLYVCVLLSTLVLKYGGQREHLDSVLFCLFILFKTPHHTTRTHTHTPVLSLSVRLSSLSTSPSPSQLPRSTHALRDLSLYLVPTRSLTHADARYRTSASRLCATFAYPFHFSRVFLTKLKLRKKCLLGFRVPRVGWGGRFSRRTCACIVRVDCIVVDVPPHIVCIPLHNHLTHSHVSDVQLLSFEIHRYEHH